MLEKPHRWVFVLLCLIILGGITSAYAAESGLTPREEALLKTVEQLEKRVADLETQLKDIKPASSPVTTAVPAAAPAASGDAAQVKSADTAVKATDTAAKPASDGGTELKAMWKNGLRFESADGEFKLQVGGRLYFDWAWFSEDAQLRNSLGDEQDGVQIRTGRINLQGEYKKNLAYRFEYDLAGNNGPTGFMDTWLAYRNIPVAGTLTVGHFKEPFGLEQLTPDPNITFMERSLTDVFTPGRNFGVGLSNAFLGEPKAERMTVSMGAFKNTDNWPSANDSDEDQGYSVTARVTGLPYYADKGRQLLHLGFAYSHRNPDGATINRYQFQPSPETRLNLFRWQNSEGYAPFRLQDARTDNVDLYGLEAALVLGAFSAQTEYMRADVETTFDNNRSFDGFYAQASWFITGENRAYRNSTGYFDRVTPKKSFEWGKGPGAWELALRYSSLNLDDGGIVGGKEDNWTIGLGWYLNPTTKVLWNYTVADIDHNLYEGQIDMFQTRFQLDF